MYHQMDSSKSKYYEENDKL